MRFFERSLSDLVHHKSTLRAVVDCKRSHCMMIHAEPDYETIFFRIVPVWSSEDMVLFQEEWKIFLVVPVQLHTQVARPIFFMEQTFGMFHSLFLLSCLHFFCVHHDCSFPGGITGASLVYCVIYMDFSCTLCLGVRVGHLSSSAASVFFFQISAQSFWETAPGCICLFFACTVLTVPAANEISSSCLFYRAPHVRGKIADSVAVFFQLLLVCDLFRLLADVITYITCHIHYRVLCTVHFCISFKNSISSVSLFGNLLYFGWYVHFGTPPALSGSGPPTRCR